MELFGQIILTVEAAIGIVGLAGGFGLFWIRLEHRLTRIETKINDLPCVNGDCVSAKKGNP